MGEKLNLPTPKSHIQEVLFDLIENGETSVKQFFWLSGFRTRISEIILKHGIFLQRIPKKHTSKHGNTTNYYIHILPENQLEKAIEIYKSLNNQKK